jgi:hypothetical protein
LLACIERGEERVSVVEGLYPVAEMRKTDEALLVGNQMNDRRTMICS